MVKNLLYFDTETSDNDHTGKTNEGGRDGTIRGRRADYCVRRH